MLSTALRACPPVTTRAPRAARNRVLSVINTRKAVHACVTRATPGHDRPGSATPQRSEAVEAAILGLTDGLRLLEAERDEAVRTAEDCAKTACKLEEMVRLLEQLALNKVAEDDDDGARHVLQEKAAVQEVLARTSGRATTNFALAGKLAEKIGQQQAEIMDLLSPVSGGSTSLPSSSSSTSSSRASQPVPSSSTGLYSSIAGRPGTPTASTSTSTSTSSSTSTGANDSSGSNFSYDTPSSSSSNGGAGAYEAPWEQSLREARQRAAQAEAQAVAAGSRAAARARETIEEARDRLRAQSFDSIAAARSRIRRSASESIEEARARIAAEDAAALAEVHKVIARYKAGDYVPEEQLDWAFAQLERRSWR